MNSKRVDYILRNDPDAKHIWKGFLAPDIPAPGNESGLYIINTAPSYTLGEHWCALWLNENKKKNVCEFFDSYGEPPSSYDLQKIIPASLVYFNNVQVQGNFQRTCAHHCLFYSLHRARGFSLKHIMNHFYDPAATTLTNDNMVQNFIFINFGAGLSKIE